MARVVRTPVSSFRLEAATVEPGTISTSFRAM